MHRRDFLDPRRLARAAADLAGAAGEIQAALAGGEPAGCEYALLRCERRAMATTFAFLLPLGTEHAHRAAADALDEVDAVEDRLTVYRDHSDVSRLNREAPAGPVRVDGELFALLQQADRIHAETDGAFDITTGALSKAWGFFRRCGRVPADAERADVVKKVGMRHVMLDGAELTVRYLRPGLEINLGSIGKGYALDRAAGVLRAGWGVRHALLHGGHSSVYGLGSEPGGDGGWPVGLRHPWEPGRRLAVVRLKDRGLGTSAATFQHVEHEGRKLGHVLDPRTGWPAEGLASATAVAPTAAEADALATAFFILGVDRTREYCRARPGVGAVLLPDGDGAAPVVIGLSPEEITLSSGFGGGNRKQ